MHEIDVPAALRDQVAHLIAYNEHLPTGTVASERVLPDGALRLIVDCTAGSAQVAGPSTRPVLLCMRGHLQGLSLTLRPGAALALFGVPAHELTDQVVPWEQLVRPGLRSAFGRLKDVNCEKEAAAVLWHTLLAMTRNVFGEERRKVLVAAALLRPSGNAQTVRAVAAAVGVSDRRLQQIFSAQLGLSPRAWRRLARMHECLRLLRRPGPVPWTELALEAGFYDQSHLVKEFRAHCGLTPGQFLQRSVSHSSKTLP